ncbi:hypothetical protein QBC37DRAFT_45809 [Rhypophila decipiens]|uniref:NAD(P)-binding domain-containing protein n=1 Tax=Rhypophila decipiens TaxID=261697 RepID=A0AAN7BBA3_9PEZI|nr:hypothetical protein QBC37DRAFT_45809 [Rhypophila decipiens]
MAAHNVLLLGGHGKIAQLLTPLLLRRSWNVTSVIRNPDQVPAIQSLAPPPPSTTGGQLNVLVRSLEDIKSQSQARSIIDEVKPDFIVWSAGAGGKGGPSRTFAIDRDAAIHFIRAAAEESSGVTRFLLISYLGSRRTKPAWWSEESWEEMSKVNAGALKNYYEAKVAADEVLYEAGSRAGQRRFVGIDLRPGTLVDEKAGKVELGKTRKSGGNVSRESVAQVADQLLAAGDVGNVWLDLLDGEDDITGAIERVVKDGVDCAEGESFYGGK